MNTQNREEISPDCGDRFIADRCCEIGRCLQDALTLKPNSHEKPLVRAQQLTAAVQECLQERMRKADETNYPQWQAAFEDADTVMRLITAVTVPPTGVHRNYIEEAGRIIDHIHQTTAAGSP